MDGPYRLDYSLRSMSFRISRRDAKRVCSLWFVVCSFLGRVFFTFYILHFAFCIYPMPFTASSAPQRETFSLEIELGPKTPRAVYFNSFPLKFRNQKTRNLAISPYLCAP